MQRVLCRYSRQKCKRKLKNDLLVTLNKGDYVMAGVNHNSHGAQVIFPDDPQFEGMPKNADIPLEACRLRISRGELLFTAVP